MLWPHGAECLEEFHAYLNEQHPQIQFTREVENDNQIRFLDALVKKEDGAYQTAVYRKTTLMDRCIHFTSHHHPRVKSGTIRCLTKRAVNICDETNMKEEKSHIRDAFARNGYPERMVECHLIGTTRQPKTTPDPVDPTTKPPSLYLPCVQGLSEKIQTACKKIGVEAVFKSHGTLRQLLMKVKSKRPAMRRKEVVYRIPCQDCDVAYIGETGRSLQKRLTEHKYAVKSNDRKNGMAVHAWDMDYRPDWDAAEVVETE